MANRVKKGGRGRGPTDRRARKPKALDPQEERLTELKRHFISDWNADEPFRRDKRVYGDFYDGDQWEQDEIQELKERGQPVVVNNRIKPKIDSILGIISDARVDTKAYAKGDRKRESEISEISEEFRAIEDDSDFDEQELQVFKDVLIDGRGWYKTHKKWDGMKYRLLTEHVKNLSLVPDRFGESPDLVDHTRIHETIWMDLEDAKKMFPGFETELEDAVNAPIPVDDIKSAEHVTHQGEDSYKIGAPSSGAEDFGEFVDKPQKRVRIVTTWERESRIKRFLMTPGQGGGVTDITEFSEEDLKKIQEMFPTSHEWKEPYKRLNTATYTWNAILEEKKNIRKDDPEAKFPFVMVVGYEKRSTGQHYGLVKQHLDPQREVNKRRSKALHLLNTTETIFDEGAFEDENKAREEFSHPDAWVKKRQGFDVQRIRHDAIAQSQFALLQEAKQEIDQAGINREIEGRSSGSSGREVQIRLKEALKSIREPLNNLLDGRKRIARDQWLEDILERFPQLRAAKYDVVVQEVPDTVTLSQETWDNLVSLAKSGVMPIPWDILLEASPLAPKVKNELLEKGKAAEEQRALLASSQANPQGGPPAGNA